MLQNRQPTEVTSAREPRHALQRFTLEFETNGDVDIIDITDRIKRELAKLPAAERGGVVHLFIVGSTAALSTVEFEPGLVKHDLRETFQRLIPDNTHYEHEATWNDDNGHSHVRATFLGPDLTVPFRQGGHLLTGTWQQIVLIDFDTRPRRRTVVGTVL